MQKGPATYGLIFMQQRLFREAHMDKKTYFARQELTIAFAKAAHSATGTAKPFFEKLDKKFATLIAKTEAYEAQDSTMNGLRLAIESVRFSLAFKSVAGKLENAPEAAKKMFKDLYATFKKKYQAAF